MWGGERSTYHSMKKRKLRTHTWQYDVVSLEQTDNCIAIFCQVDSHDNISLDELLQFKRKTTSKLSFAWQGRIFWCQMSNILRIKGKVTLTRVLCLFRKVTVVARYELRYQVQQ